MPIYTKKGDRGQTSLGTGDRVWKDSTRVNAYGTIDELNSVVGVIIAEIGKPTRAYKRYLLEILNLIQNDFFCCASYLANPENTDLISHLEPRTQFFEEKIDQMTAEMPPLRNFIFPGGGKTGAYLHQARTVSRRAERAIVSLLKKEQVDEDVVKYINRISDLFLTMSRYANFKEKKLEAIWSRKNNLNIDNSSRG